MSNVDGVSVGDLGGQRAAGLEVDLSAAVNAPVSHADQGPSALQVVRFAGETGGMPVWVGSERIRGPLSPGLIALKWAVDQDRQAGLAPQRPQL